MRTLVATVLVIAVLVAALWAWRGTATSEAASRAAELRDGQRRAAHDKVRNLADGVVAELEALRTQETMRPYYHYQNLYHDPLGASQGLAVLPSPLAAGPVSPLARSHFQLRANGERWDVSLPTINDDLPELSAKERSAAETTLRTELSAAASSIAASAALAIAAPATAAPTIVAPDNAANATTANVGPKDQANQQQVTVLTPSQYTQNANANFAYSQAKLQQQRVALADPPLLTRAPPRSVQITVSPLTWQSTSIGGRNELVAIRRVDTPSGMLLQGLVVDGEAITRRLRDRDASARLVADASPILNAAIAEPFPRWRLAVPITMDAVDNVIASTRRSFNRTFLLVAIAASLTGLLLIGLVANAERLARTRSRFAAAAAHELRTPLAGLALYGDMLAEGLGEPARHRDYARRISEEAARLGRVVSNVLGFSQLEQRRLSLTVRSADVAVCVHEVAERLRPSLERSGIKLDLDVEGPLTAQFDPDAVARIIDNLVDNAEKYSRGHDPRWVKLSGRQNQHTIEISVSDSGPGVPKHTKLFAPFRRGPNPDAPAGLGLGLAMSRAAARAMGGDLLHTGASTFVLRLATSD